MVTIKDVAKAAQVSIATVSRVINDNYPVSKDTRERVLKVIDELNFQPNGIARSLKKRRTNIIGTVVPDITNPFYMELIKGIESTVSNEGYIITLCNTDESPEKELKFLRILAEKRIDAIILSSCESDGTYINEIIDKGTPIILIDRKIRGVKADLIANDNFEGAYELTKYLIKRGHKDICIINGLLSVSTGQERFNGFKKAMMENDIPVKNEFVLEGDYNFQKAYESTKKMLMQDKIPTAIIAANNLMAEGVMIALREAGLKIPDDVSLVTFEKIRNQELINPKLTYIKQNASLIGKKAGELALEKLSSENENWQSQTREIVLVSDLVVSESVKEIR